MSTPEVTLEQIEAHLKTNPKDASAWNVKAVILANQEDYGEALRCLEQAIRLNPKLAEAHTNRGRVLLALGRDRAEQAVKSFKTALSLKHDDVIALRDIAFALSILRRTEEELSYLERLSKLTPEDSNMWTRLGVLEHQRGRAKEAVSYLDKALGLDNNSVSALLHRALALATLEEWKEAVDTAKRATKLAKDEVDPWRVLGDVTRKAGKYKSAMKAFRRAAEIDPEDASIMVSMGKVAQEDRKAKDAIKYFRKALVRDKDHITALVSLGVVYMELEEWEDAKAAWDRLTGLVKNNPDIFDAQAMVHARLEDFCAAADAWEKARKLYKKRGDSASAKRVTELGRAARINCSRMKKAIREQKEQERLQRRHGRGPSTRRR